jgi:Na+/proline symporter
MNDEIKTGLDLAAVAGGVGSWLALLPDIAALLSIAWLALRIWETETVKRLTGRD